MLLVTPKGSTGVNHENSWWSFPSQVFSQGKKERKEGVEERGEGQEADKNREYLPRVRCVSGTF